MGIRRVIGALRVRVFQIGFMMSLTTLTIGGSYLFMATYLRPSIIYSVL